MAPLFDASALSVASGLQSNTLTQSWTHTAGAGANNCGIICVHATNSGSGTFVPNGTPTANIGGVSLTYLGSVLQGGTNIAGWIEMFAGLNVPTGAQTATYTSVHSGNNVASAFGTSHTYTGVGSFGTLQTAQAVSAAPSVTVPSAAGHTVFGAMSNYQTMTYSSPSFTQRQTNTAASPYFTAGDMAGVASAVFSATQSGSLHWAAVGLDLLPAAAALVVPSIKVTQAINRSSRY